MLKKDILRDKLNRRRRQMSDEAWVSKSLAISRHVLELPEWKNVRTVHIYDSVAEWKEVNTDYLKIELGRCWPNIKIISSSVSKTATVPSKQFDIIVVPMLGFDKERSRLGLGGGWYDRFLAAQPRALKIGLAYESARLENIPKEPHDVPMDKIVTEKGII